MKKRIKERIYWFLTIGIRFFFNKVIIDGDTRSKLILGKNVRMKNTRIFLAEKSFLEIGENVQLENINLTVNGKVLIGESSKVFSSGYKRNYIDVDGTMICGQNNRLETNVRVRFKGFLKIGDYNNINTDSEIRCDESVEIGSFNQISYEVMIWDTNTHNVYSAEQRRNITVNRGLGFEFEKPKTKKIVIGDDCWIGKRVSILKGTQIGNRCIVGYGAVLSNQKVQENTTLVTDYSYKRNLNNI